MTLKEALTQSNEEMATLRDGLESKAKESGLNAYVGFERSGEGVPILIKDNIQVKDWAVTAGSKILQGYIAPYEATVITKLKSKGMMAFGRANMDEFAMGSTTESSFYGATINPHGENRVPGGSSGGSAAAVAAGLAIAALGSDTGGSIRQPASYCGVVGMKPTYGRVSRFGLGAYASSLDQIGPITQTVEDAVILYDAISGHDEKDSTSADFEDENLASCLDSNVKLRIAVIDSYVESADEDIQKAFRETVAKLEEAGHSIVKKELSNTKYDIATYYVLATAEAATNLARYDGVRYGTRAEAKTTQEMFYKSRSEGFGEEVKRRIMLGNFVLSSGYYDAYYVKAQKVRHLIRDEFSAIFEDADLILSPVAPSVAPKIGASASALEMYKSDMYTIGVNLAGLPAISVPVGKNAEGMPIGLQLIAKAFDEKTMFNGALSLEKSVNYSK
ncbi:Aspartyl-tRNA(Asn) amidotransferase subunit A @ Glutamyl-tRNA(Gln) amidotransferase subunit A [hydrothermal vent metagenome]|uniref:glutaminyl-tRNA synthase (glutamine-hydrolyzing) n=1 Tax=hydrothermal vent metagenome TaxID=652676 RepID=A0A1W1D121_9ZZZZ